MYKLTAVVISTVLLLTAGCVASSQPVTPTSEASAPTAVSYENTAQPLALVSGTIRWVSATEWIVLDDAGHEPTGISSVTVMADRVRVSYDFTATKVSSLQATPDEAFASANVRVGASVGLSHADIFFYMPSYGSAPVPPKLLSKANANVWITGMFWVEE